MNLFLKNKKIVCLILLSTFYFLFSILLWPVFVQAQSETLNFLKNVAENAHYPILNNDPVLIVIRIINYLLSFLGVVFILMIVWGGFLWMTAAGNEEKVGKAKKTLQHGLVGLVIVLLSLVIYNFVVELLGRQSNGGGVQTTP